jgi:hypothetical protein
LAGHAKDDIETFNMRINKGSIDTDLHQGIHCAYVRTIVRHQSEFETNCTQGYLRKEMLKQIPAGQAENLHFANQS